MCRLHFHFTLVNAFIIPQQEIDEFVTADDCASGERDDSGVGVNVNGHATVETSESERESDSEGESGAHGWDTLDRHARGLMDASTPIRVHKKKRRRSGDGNAKETQEEIVTTPHREPRPLTRRPKSPAAERITVSSSHGQIGSSNETTQINTRLKSGSVKRTYAGPRKIKDAPEPSISASSIAGPSTDLLRLSGLTRCLEDDEVVGPEGRDAIDLLRTETSSSRTPSRKVTATYGSSVRSSDGPSQISNATSQQRKHEEYAKNTFYANLSKAINGQRRQALNHATLLGKSRPQLPSSSSHHTLRPEPTDQRRRPRERARHSSSFCVLIPPCKLPVPREMFKSIDEHIAEEEQEQEQERRKRERRKQVEREHESERNVDVRPKYGPAVVRTYGKQDKSRGPPKQKQSLKDAIYVSSGSEAPIAGPSRLADKSKRRTSSSTDELARQVEDEHAVPTPVKLTSKNKSLPSNHVSPRKVPSRSPTSTKPKTTVKSLKKKREEIVVSSGSESDVILIENALDPSLSPFRHASSSASLQAPPSLPPTQSRSTGRCRREADARHAIEQDPEELGESVPLVEGEVTRTDEDRASNVSRKDSSTSSSITRKKDSNMAAKATASRKPELPEIVVTPKAATLPVHDRSTQPMSPTVCLSRSPSHVTSRSPSSRSTTLAVPEEPPLSQAVDSSDEKSKARAIPKHKREVVQKDATQEEGHSEDADEGGILSTSEEESDHGSETGSESSSSAEELDDVCHRCRNRNVYAKMKCRKVKKNGVVCPLHYCHRCIVVFFPKIEFDPFSVVFACPSCAGTCDCISCCKKRGDIDQHQLCRKRWDELGVTLLLSQQETRRREQQAKKKAAGPKRDKARYPKRTKRAHGGDAAKAKEKKEVNIGKEAEGWIRRQSVGKRNVRAFVGAWQDAWGPTPFCVHEMGGVDFDAHAITGAGKGKGKAVDPDARLYVGDRKALNRPFVRAEDIMVSVPDPESVPARSPSPPRKKRPGRPKKRKQDTSDVIYVTPAEIPNRKKRRTTDPITIPEFTMNHYQDAASSNATSPFYHPTPDDLTPFHSLEVNSHMKYPGIVNDPMLGAVNGPYSSDALGVDMYAPDWDSVATGKPLATEAFSETDFSYQGMYNSYAAALGGVEGVGVEQYDYVDALRFSPEKISKSDEHEGLPGSEQPALLQSQEAEKDLTQLIDPALIEHDPKAPNEVPDLDSDPTRFLTPHAQASSTLLSVPMIYGVPSSTGLSLSDLQRTMRESLSALRLLA
ncbi:hypothetical protein ACEPAI_1561 [Sanghuangporus weigelae]